MRAAQQRYEAEQDDLGAKSSADFKRVLVAAMLQERRWKSSKPDTVGVPARARSRRPRVQRTPATNSARGDDPSPSPLDNPSEMRVPGLAGQQGTRHDRHGESSGRA